MSKARRMVLADLSAGMKGILTEYNKALRSVERAICMPSNGKDWAAIVDQNYDIAQQKLIRKLYRLENGVNVTDVERLKRDFRKLAAGYIEAVTNGKDSHDLWVMCQQIVENKRRL